MAASRPIQLSCEILSGSRGGSDERGVSVWRLGEPASRSRRRDRGCRVAQGPRERRRQVGACAGQLQQPFQDRLLGLSLRPRGRQVAQVVARLQIQDRSGQEGLGRIVGVVTIGGEEGGQLGLGQRYRPWLAEMIGPAGEGVLAQDDASPVDRSAEDPVRLRSRTLCGFDLHRAPLLPDHRRCQRGDQRDDHHRGQQRGAALPGSGCR